VIRIARTGIFGPGRAGLVWARADSAGRAGGGWPGRPGGGPGADQRVGKLPRTGW
jgi:hypothetical protein